MSGRLLDREVGRDTGHRQRPGARCRPGSRVTTYPNGSPGAGSAWLFNSKARPFENWQSNYSDDDGTMRYRMPERIADWWQELPGES